MASNHTHGGANGGETARRNAVREACVALAAFFAFGTLCISLSHWLGYGLPADEVALIAGVPSWVVWGVFAPWAGALAFTAWFGLRYVRDEDTEPGGEGD